jgi:VWFA-related protein
MSLSRRGLLLSSLVAPFLRAQQQGTTFSTDVKLVNVFATVRNKQGQIVRNLTKDDFTLDEDGRPQTIRYFSRETDLPLTVGLLIDTSGSQRRVLGAESHASYKFLQQVLREDKDQAFLIHFDREVELLQDLTSSRKRLEEALTGIETPTQSSARPPGGPAGGPGGRRGGRQGGGTSLYDAVLLASDEIMRPQKGRKALIMLSDGVDNGSKITLSNAIESAQRADTLVYSVLFADPNGYGGFTPGPRMGGGGRRGGGRPPARPPVQQRHPDGKKILQRLAHETGGAFYEVSKKTPIEQVYKSIEEELRNQYSLGYLSDATESTIGFRQIHLQTKQNNLTVQTREGYYPHR